MQLPHPQYSDLQIVVGERARAGAWFVPTIGQTLSQIANQAYGVGALAMALRIDKSPWNRNNLVYRTESNNCDAKVVNSALAVSQSSFAPGAWIALCQQDTPSWAMAMGFAFPPVWVPGLGGEEPDVLSKGPEITLSPEPPLGFNQVIEGPAIGEPQPVVPPVAPQGGFRWYHGVAIGGVAVAIVGIAWAASRKKNRGG